LHTAADRPELASQAGQESAQVPARGELCSTDASCVAMNAELLKPDSVLYIVSLSLSLSLSSQPHRTSSQQVALKITLSLAGLNLLCPQEHLLMSEHRRETKRMRAGGKDAIVNVMTVKAQEQQALQELEDGQVGRGGRKKPCLLIKLRGV